jgi:hypothetical protein
LFIILSVFEKHYSELQKGWLDESQNIKHKNNVPVASIMCTDYIPTATALLLKKAIAKMIDKGEIKKKDIPKALELMANSYLDSLKQKE